MLKAILFLLLTVGSSNAFAYPVGPCLINQADGLQSYQVFDGYGDYILSTPDYNTALETAEQYDQAGYCQGIRINMQPYPNQPHYPPHTFCMVRYGRDANGNQFFRVLDGAGRIIYTTPNYREALDIAQNDQRCFQPQAKTFLK